MPLPLIVKAAAVGGAAYLMTRWMAEQRRQRISTVNVFPTSETHGDGAARAARGSLARENHPGDAPLAPGVSAGPSS
jgi:hypothetical protein